MRNNQCSKCGKFIAKYHDPHIPDYDKREYVAVCRVCYGEYLKHKLRKSKYIQLSLCREINYPEEFMRVLAQSDPHAADNAARAYYDALNQKRRQSYINAGADLTRFHEILPSYTYYVYGGWDSLQLKCTGGVSVKKHNWRGCLRRDVYFTFEGTKWWGKNIAGNYFPSDTYLGAVHCRRLKEDQ